MKLIKSQLLVSVLLVLVVGSTFANIRAVQAECPAQYLSMSDTENVALLSNGYANVIMLINVAASPLADMYRRMLAAPADAGVGVEMPIPENTTQNGGVLPVRQEFYRSVEQEQENLFGFGTWITSSSMVPRGKQGEFTVSVSAYDSVQVANFTASGQSGLWDVTVGPTGWDAAGAAAELALTAVKFAKQMLQSLNGTMGYEADKTVRIELPGDALLLNGGELAGLSWAVSFGGGNLMTASVSVDGQSTVVLDERTVVTQDNITAASADIFQAFSTYGVFNIKYLLPHSTFVGGRSGLTINRDPDWPMSLSPWIPSPPVTFSDSQVSAKLTFTPSFAISSYVGFDFHWYGALDWFEAWIGASASLKAKLEVTAKGADDYSWSTNEFQFLLYEFEFSIDYVPVWIDLDYAFIPYLNIHTTGPASLSTEADVTASFKLGVRYHNGWSPIAQADTQATLQTSTMNISDTMSFDTGCKVRFLALVYSIAGPYVEVHLPRITGTMRYVAADDFTTWEIDARIKASVGITFQSGLADLVGLSDYYVDLFDSVIHSWSGTRPGICPSSISISISPTSTFNGIPVLVSGSVSSPYPGDFSGPVHVDYSSDGQNWNSSAASTYADSTGAYSCLLAIPTTGTYYVRARYDGNSGYKGAENASSASSGAPLILPVQPIALTVTAHGIYDQSGGGYWYGSLTNTFYPSSGGVWSVVTFNQPQQMQPIRWDWYLPNGTLWFTDGGNWSESGGGKWWSNIGIDLNRGQTLVPGEWYAMREGARLNYTSYFGKTFTVSISFAGTFVLNETWLFTKYSYGPTIDVTKGDNFGGWGTYLLDNVSSITLGDHVGLHSRDPLFALSYYEGPLSFEYSTDNVTWTTLFSGPVTYHQDESGEPWNPNGIDYNWKPPHVGTYYIRTVSSGDYVNYETTSSVWPLVVTQASPSLTTWLSANTVMCGSNVTITPEVTPSLQQNLAVQYSYDEANWYNLAVLSPYYSYTWTPPAPGTYYIRSQLLPSYDSPGANSTAETLTVTSPDATSVEIVDGANAQVDRTPGATVQLGVKVKDITTGQYLKGAGTVEFYVSDYSHNNIVFAGSDNDSGATGTYSILWNASSWPTLGPQHWSAYFTGTPNYTASWASTDFTIYLYDAALWVNPTFQEVNAAQTATYLVNFAWNRNTADTFALSLTGLNSSWHYTFSQPSITVNSQGQTRQTTLTVSAPTASMPLVDQGFEVAATDGNSFSVSANATVRAGTSLYVPPNPAGPFNVTFQELGLTLAPADPWWVDLNGVNQSSTSNTIVFSTQNGTYTYTVGASGYYAYLPTQSVTVHSNMNVQIPFYVIPEFPSLAPLPLFMTASLLAVAICRKKKIAQPLSG